MTIGQFGLVGDVAKRIGESVIIKEGQIVVRTRDASEKVIAYFVAQLRAGSLELSEETISS